MFFRLFLLFTAVPLLELALLIEVGSRIGVVATLALVIFTGALGAALARAQGFAVLRRIQMELAEGRSPASSLVDGALILAAGLLLITPGLLTDALGFALLLPPFRAWIKGQLRRRFEAYVAAHEIRVRHYE
ncbi:MAG: FxsA family protein [Nitrospinota bacterium]